MHLLDQPNVVSLKHCFFSTTEKDELYLNLVLEYVPETVHCVIKHYNKLNQRMPLIYVKPYYGQCLYVHMVNLNFFFFGNCSCLILLEQRYLNVKLVLTRLRVSDWCSTPWTVSLG